MYVSNNYTNKSILGVYQDGTFTMLSFTITIQDLSFRAEEVRLKDEDGNIVSEKNVLKLEVLKTVQRVKIIL